MSEKSDHIAYRGWRIWVATPLGFFALVLVLIVPALGAVAVASGTLRWLAGAALIGFPAGLVLLVARLAVYHPHALRGEHAQEENTARARRRKVAVSNSARSIGDSKPADES